MAYKKLSDVLTRMKFKGSIIECDGINPPKIDGEEIDIISTPKGLTSSRRGFSVKNDIGHK